MIAGVRVGEIDALDDRRRPRARRHAAARRHPGPRRLVRSRSAPTRCSATATSRSSRPAATRARRRCACSQSGEPHHPRDRGRLDRQRAARDRARRCRRSTTASTALHDVALDGRDWVHGPLDDGVGDADGWLADGTLEQPLEAADRAIAARRVRRPRARADAVARRARRRRDVRSRSTTRSRMLASRWRASRPASHDGLADSARRHRPHRSADRAGRGRHGRRSTKAAATTGRARSAGWSTIPSSPTTSRMRPQSLADGDRQLLALQVVPRPAHRVQRLLGHARASTSPPRSARATTSSTWSSSRRARSARYPSDALSDVAGLRPVQPLPADPRLDPVHRAVRQAVRLVRSSAAASRTRRSASAPTSCCAAGSSSRPTCSARFDRTPRLKLTARASRCSARSTSSPASTTCSTSPATSRSSRATPTSRKQFDTLRYGRDYFLGGTLHSPTRISRRCSASTARCSSACCDPKRLAAGERREQIDLVAVGEHALGVLGERAALAVEHHRVGQVRRVRRAPRAAACPRLRRPRRACRAWCRPACAGARRRPASRRRSGRGSGCGSRMLVAAQAVEDAHR